MELQNKPHSGRYFLIYIFTDAYCGKRYIIEMKIWHGERYNAEGEQQLLDYLDAYGLKTGYLLSFSFRKTKKSGVEEIPIGDKLIYEGIV